MAEVKVAVFTEKGGHRAAIKVDWVTIVTPPLENGAFYLGLGAMAAGGLVEWPLALALIASHLLLDAVTNRPALHELGEALEEA